MEGKQFSSSQRRGDLRPRHARALPARRAALLHLARPARRTRTATSPGRSSSGAPTTSWSPAGATWSTGPRRWSRRASARSRRPASSTAEDQALLDRVEAAFGDGRRADRAAPAEGRARRGDAHRRRGQQVRLRPGAVEAQGRRRARAARHRSCTSSRRRSPTATCCSRRSCRTARTPSTGCSAAPATSRRCREIREVEDLDGGPALPDHHRRLLRRPAPGSAVRSWPARRSPSRRRCSPSSTRRWSTRSWPGSRRRA